MICGNAVSVPEGENKMVRRSLAVLGLAFAALVLLAPVASAQYVDDGSIDTDDPNPDVGDSITITGTACGEPGVDVTVSISQGGSTVVLGQVTTGPDGSYTLTAAIPDSFSNGTAVISDTCGASLTITIGAVAGTSLPRTGSDTGTLWRIAVGLVAAGGILVLGARKRLTGGPATA
jgi:LPXTG-motif cell wall-anchored protein